MATFEVTRSFGASVDNTKIKFSKLYLRQIWEGPNTNQTGPLVSGDPALQFGLSGVNSWGIYDDLGSEAKLVAKAQGWHTAIHPNWYSWFSMTFFEGERYA